MPGWLPPARQNFCRSNALGMPLISIMPGQLPELKGERGSPGRPFPFQQFPCKTARLAMRSARFHVFSLPGGQIAQANGKEPPGKADESVKEEGGEVPFLQQQEGFIHQRGKGGETAAQACGKKEPRFRMQQAPVEQTVEEAQDKTSQQVDCRRALGERTCRIDLDEPGQQETQYTARKASQAHYHQHFHHIAAFSMF